MSLKTKRSATLTHAAATYKLDVKLDRIREQMILIAGTIVVLWLQVVFRATLIGRYFNY